MQAPAKRAAGRKDESDDDVVIDLGSESDSEDDDFEAELSGDEPSPTKPKSRASASTAKRCAARATD